MIINIKYEPKFQMKITQIRDPDLLPSIWRLLSCRLFREAWCQDVGYEILWSIFITKFNKNTCQSEKRTICKIHKSQKHFK